MIAMRKLSQSNNTGPNSIVNLECREYYPIVLRSLGRKTQPKQVGEFDHSLLKVSYYCLTNRLSGLPTLLYKKGVLKTFFYNFSTISTKFDIKCIPNESKGI